MKNPSGFFDFSVLAHSTYKRTRCGCIPSPSSLPLGMDTTLVPRFVSRSSTSPAAVRSVFFPPTQPPHKFNHLICLSLRRLLSPRDHERSCTLFVSTRPHTRTLSTAVSHASSYSLLSGKIIVLPEYPAIYPAGFNAAARCVNCACFCVDDYYISTITGGRMYFSGRRVCSSR